MSDQTAFINAFIDQAVETTHNYLNDILQLKTKLKLANDLIAQHTQTISTLTEQTKNNSVNVEDLNRARANAKEWEEKHNSLLNKSSHMDALVNQHNELKADYSKVCIERDELRRELEELKSAINTKEKETNSSTSGKKKNVKVEVNKKEEIDDF